MAIKLRNSSREKKELGSWTGILVAVLLTALIAAGVMAFYPWLSSEMTEGKQVFTLKEWESSQQDFSYEETGSYGDEAEMYDSGYGQRL